MHNHSLGDVNNSGVVDIVDALLIARYHVGLNPQSFNSAYADVDCTGSIDIINGLLIAQFHVGLMDEFPCPTTTTTSASGSIFHVFLLLGQSNMAGYPTAHAADKVEDSRIIVLGYDDCSATGRVTDQWDVACPPLHECWNGAIGPGDWFAKILIDVLPSGDTIGLVPFAISGEKIETFMKVGGTKYNWIINRARLAQQAGGVIEGILFHHQGESNNGDPAWPGNVNTLITDLRTELGIGNVPYPCR